MKKIFMFLTLGVFALSLAGCVEIDEDPYEVDCEEYPTHPLCLDDVDPNSDEAPGIINVLDELPSEDITVTFWHTYGQGKTALLETFIADFEELYPNVTIDAVFQGGYEDIRDLTGNAISVGGSLPTVVIGYPDHIAEYLKGNAVIPLDDFAKNETWGVDLDDFIQSYLDENTQYPGGYLYSFPYSKSTEMMVYNKDIIEANATAIEAALGEPFPDDRPLTWAELDLLAEILVADTWDRENPTAGQCEYLINFDSAANFFINSVRQWDGGYTNSDGDILIDNANTRAMLEYVEDRFESNTFAIPLAFGEAVGYGSDDFKAGNLCMSVGSTAGVDYNIPADGFEVGILPTPQYSEDHLSAVQQGPNIAIMSKSSDAERLAAWLFIKFLTNSENTAAWAMDTGYLPVRHSGFNSDEYTAFLAITDKTDDQYYFSLASQAAALQTDYYNYDPAFAGAFTSSDARDAANVLMEALFGIYSVDEVIDDMLASLGQ